MFHRFLPSIPELGKPALVFRMAFHRGHSGSSLGVPRLLGEKGTQAQDFASIEQTAFPAICLPILWRRRGGEACGGGPSPVWLLIFLTIKHLFVAARLLRIDLFLVVEARHGPPCFRGERSSPSPGQHIVLGRGRNSQGLSWSGFVAFLGKDLQRLHLRGPEVCLCCLPRCLTQK